MTTKRKPAIQEAPMINITASQKESVTEARAAIMDILRCKDVTNETKRTALEVLDGLCAIKNVTIQNVVLNKGVPEK